jgi:hypothetical protein
MNMRKARVVLAAMAGLAAVLFVQQQRLERLRAENAALRVQTGELAALRADQQRRADPSLAPAETARLREQQAELLRLRGEVTRLRNEARQNAARGATAGPPAAVAAPPSSQPEADPAPFTAAATVSLASGATFATGGWLTSPGARTFLLATPSLDENASGGKAINLAMSLLKVAEADLPEALLRKLQDQAPAESLVLTGTEVALLMSRLDSGAETNVLSRPRITTSDGVPASLFIGEVRPNPDGTQRQVGTMIDVSPRIGQDGQTITMGVNLEYVPREEHNEDEAPPKAN